MFLIEQLIFNKLSGFGHGQAVCQDLISALASALTGPELPSSQLPGKNLLPGGYGSGPPGPGRRGRETSGFGQTLGSKTVRNFFRGLR